MASLRRLRWQEQLAARTKARFFRLMAKVDAELAGSVADAARRSRRIIASLPEEGVGAAARRAQYALVRRQLLEIQQELWQDTISRTLMREIEAATDLALDQQDELLRILTRGAGKMKATALVESLKTSAANTFATLRSRVLNNIKLSSSVYRNRAYMTGKIDQIVNDGILLGRSAKEIADSVVTYINPDTPGGARYAAQRLGRTELNNAFRTTSQLAYAASPYVDGVVWTLSGSHSEEDECDELAAADDFGLGEGVYPTDEVPFAPHPQCFCYLVPITPTPEQFIESLVEGGVTV